MIIKCAGRDEAEILTYIGAEYPSCLYLYLNLKKFGFSSERTEVFVQKDANRIESVLLRYYSCLHVYSRDNRFPVEELARFIEGSELSVVYCKADTAKRIFAALPERFRAASTLTTGWVAQIQAVDQPPKGLSFPAQKEDFDQIVRLIYDDAEIGRNYRFDELAHQLKERNREGFARNLVIKEEGTVVAHACTNAEYSGIAVVAELLVKPDHRRRGLASEIWRALCATLLAEGNEVFSIFFSEESRALHRKIGFFEVCEWGKIVLDKGA